MRYTADNVDECDGDNIFDVDWEDGNVEGLSWYENHKTVPAFTIKLTASGDYCNGTVQRANFIWLTEQYPWLPTESMSYGYDAVKIRWDDIEEVFTPEHYETYLTKILPLIANAAYDYPLYDDDSLTEYEMKIQNDWWENSGAQDFLNEITSKFEDWLEEQEYILPETKAELEAKIQALGEPTLKENELLCKMLYESMEKANVYYTHEDIGWPYVDFEKIFKEALTIEKILAYVNPPPAPDPNQLKLPLEV